MGSTHSGRLERWLGRDQVENISAAMRGYPGPAAIPIGNIPGTIYATRDGDFVGSIRGGYYATLFDLSLERTKRGLKRWERQRPRIVSAGFTSLSDLINEATANGKQQTLHFAKTGVAGIANIANSLWDVGAHPPAGGTSAAAAGSSPTNATTGALPIVNATGGDTLHFCGATVVPTVGNNTLLLYDRFFQVNHNLTTDPQAVSGVPTRYQSAAAAGAMITVFVTGALGSGTPTYTITYVDQAGNTAEDAAAQTIVGSAIARRFPFAASVGNGWFIPLNAGDTGVQAITNLNLSAASTGTIDVVLAKPLVWLPCGIANFPVVIDGINSAFNLAKIEDNAALALMEINKGATTATSYSGQLIFVSG